MILIFLLATLFVADDARTELRGLLAGGPARAAARAALDEHVAFDRALAEVLADPSVGEARKDALAREALAISPMLVPPTFTDGRVPTGWDLAYRRALALERASGSDTAALVALIERHFDPEIWEPREGLATLEQLVATSAGEPLAAQTLFRAADRLAPFPKYHAELERALDAAVAQPVSGLARHLIALARLRLAVGDGPDSFGVRDAALWLDAERWAPSPEAAELTALAGLHDRWRRGARETRVEVLSELARWSEASRSAASASAAPSGSGSDSGGRDVAAAVHFKGLELLARLSALEGDVPTALAWVDALEARGAPPRQAAANLVLLTRLVVDRLAPDEPTGRAALGESLARAATALDDAPMRSAVEWALAQIAALEEEHEREQEHLRRAAKLALSGAEPPPVEEHLTSWWTPLPRPARSEVEPIEASRLASWWVATRAYEEGDWATALRHYAPPAPVEGCGNHIEDVLTYRRLQISRCHEELGQLDEARAVLRGLARENVIAWTSSEAIVALVDFELRHDGTDELVAWLEARALAPEKAARASGYLDYRAALASGDVGRVREAAEWIRARWPEDEVLVARVASESLGLQPEPEG